MFFTIHRYIFRELFRVFVLTTLALTVMLSIGMILRPVQEYGVGPRQVVHLMGYFLPITLTFVLPIAALFASSLVYGRFATDNELDACRASGISMLTLVYPGLVLAIAVAIANLVLSFYVMPAFVERAVKATKADAQQIVFRNIQQKGYYKPSDGAYLIYADGADSRTNMLIGVVIVEMSKGGVKRIIAAEKARVKFSPHKRFNDLQVTAYNAYQMGSENEGGFSFESLSLNKEFPPLLSDDIKFKKIDKMKAIIDDPMRFDPIAKLAYKAYGQFVTELLAEEISAKIAGDSDKYYQLKGMPTSVKFTAQQCIAKDDETVELSGNVEAIEYETESGKVIKTMQCERVSLRVEGEDEAPTLTMQLYSPQWQRADGQTGFARRFRIRGLIVPEAVAVNFKSINVLESIRPGQISAALQKGPSRKLQQLESSLWSKIDKTFLEIKAETHSRLVFGIGCISVILVGIGLGVIKKGAHLLSAFGISAIPAAMLIVFIMMGKNVTKNTGAHAGSGIILMWTGLILLTAIAFAIHRKLMKN